MLAACKLHQAGIIHGQLTVDRERGTQHFVIASDGSIRIVDYSMAHGHWGICNGAVPYNPYLKDSHYTTGCPELEALDEQFYYFGCYPIE